MSDTPEIKLNEFGDLSRRQRRELEAKGIDPDTAVLEYLNTQSIPIQRLTEQVGEVSVEAAAEDTVAPAVESYVPQSTTEVPEVKLDVPTTTAEVFPASMSKRDIRNVLDRANPVDESLVTVTPMPSAVEEPVVNLDPFSAILASAVTHVDEADDSEDIDEVEVDAPAPSPAVVATEVQPVEIDEDSQEELDQADDAEEFEVETYSGPTTISEATAAAALEEAIAAHNAARVDNGVDVTPSELPTSSDYEDFSGPSTGSIPTISNALILPTLPEDTGTIIPVVPTGELIITEQVMLPSSIAQVGAESGTLDTSEIDIIADEEEIAPSQDLAPVRAASAVSSYNSNNAVVTVPKRMNDRLPFILSITAAGLAVAVVALFVTGYILGLF